MTGLVPTTTIGGLPLGLIGDLDDTALVPVRNKNGKDRRVPLPLFRQVFVAGNLGRIAPGDGTAHDPTYMAGASSVLGVDSAVTSANTTLHWLGAHYIIKQTVANAAGSIQGLETATWAAHPSGTLGAIYGFIGNLFHTGAGTTTNAYGITGGLVISDGVVTNYFSVSAGGATITGTGAVTNNYGLVVGPVSGGTALNWAIYCFSSATSGGVCFRNSVLATTATTGFPHMPSCAGLPTGVPANIPTAQYPFVYDSVNKKICVYDGGWIKTAALT